jgi:hypothetical protein
MHADAPSAAANRPATQLVHSISALVVPFADAYVPLRQRCTARQAVCPGDAWNWPLTHATHVWLALTCWIWPGAHRSQ